MKNILVLLLLLLLLVSSAGVASAAGGGVWMANPFLVLMYCSNRPLYDAFIAAGYQLYTCVDWDATGHMIDGVCDAPPPAFPAR